uniref:Uncharacterized protein n=1 Tax=Arundo donax TaxID=35708 RepID=A0A0A9AQI8_ARUDO
MSNGIENSTNQGAKRYLLLKETSPRFIYFSTIVWTMQNGNKVFAQNKAVLGGRSFT